MLRLKTVRYVWGTALAASLACGAAAQPESAEKQLADAQELRTFGRFAEARAIYLGLLHEVRKNPSANRLAAVVLDCLGVDDQDSGHYPEAETAFNRRKAPRAIVSKPRKCGREPARFRASLRPPAPAVIRLTSRPCAR
jgi:hypothetical protein